MKTILVIEDDTVARLALKILLEKFGHKVIEAENGLDGFNMAKNFNPDLIFCDLKMPNYDGIEFLKLKCTEGITIPTIMLTAYDEISNTVFPQNADFSLVLVKPISRITIIDILEHYLG